MINLNLLKEQKEQETFRAGRGWKLTLCSRSCTFSSNRYKDIEKYQRQIQLDHLARNLYPISTYKIMDHTSNDTATSSPPLLSF